jgi:hypothetical protein
MARPRYVVTEFDGDVDLGGYDRAMQPYLMDFVVTLGPVFGAMRDFIRFVMRHKMPIPVWSALPDATMIDLLFSRRVLSGALPCTPRPRSTSPMCRPTSCAA